MFPKLYYILRSNVLAQGVPCLPQEGHSETEPHSAASESAQQPTKPDGAPSSPSFLAFPNQKGRTCGRAGL